MKRIVMAIAALAALGFASGCGGDPVKRMLGDPATRAKVMDGIAADPTYTREAADRLMMEDSTRVLVFERALGNGESRKALIVSVARDQVLVDGVIQFAVQDSASRAHVMTLFKGIQMAESK
jgi:hypothetical protein